MKRLFEQAEAADAEEDERYGRDRRGDELPAGAGAAGDATAADPRGQTGVGRASARQAQSKGEPEEKAEKAKPETKMQYNFTDRESRIMPGADGFVQAYNTQIAVEPDFQLIAGQRVTQATNDNQQLVPTVEAIGEQAGQKPEEVWPTAGIARMPI